MGKKKKKKAAKAKRAEGAYVSVRVDMPLNLPGRESISFKREPSVCGAVDAGASDQASKERPAQVAKAMPSHAQRQASSQTSQTLDQPSQAPDQTYEALPQTEGAANADEDESEVMRCQRLLERELAVLRRQLYRHIADENAHPSLSPSKAESPVVLPAPMKAQLDETEAAGAQTASQSVLPVPAQALDVQPAISTSPVRTAGMQPATAAVPDEAHKVDFKLEPPSATSAPTSAAVAAGASAQAVAPIVSPDTASRPASQTSVATPTPDTLQELPSSAEPDVTEGKHRRHKVALIVIVCLLVILIGAVVTFALLKTNTISSGAAGTQAASSSEQVDGAADDEGAAASDQGSDEGAQATGKAPWSSNEETLTAYLDEAVESL